jgi:hypothetical protein
MTPTDSVLSLEARVKADIYSARAALAALAASASGEEAEGASAQARGGGGREGLRLEELRPDVVSASLLAVKFDSFAAAGRPVSIPIAWDAPLANFFPLEKELNFEVFVDTD